MTTTWSTSLHYLDDLKADFPYFLQEVWRLSSQNLWQFAPLGAIELDIAHYSQTGPINQIILARRNIGKTTFISVGRTLWDLLRDPSHARIVVLSKSDGFAKRILRLARLLIDDVPFLRHLRPRAEQRDGATAFDVAQASPDKQPSMASYGITGQYTGNRASHLIGDDIETPENTKTLEGREDLARRVKEFRKIATYGEQRITLVGTYHHEQSVYLTMHGRGYAVRSWPIIAPHPGDKVVGLAPIIQHMIDAGVKRPSSEKSRFDGDIIEDRVDDEYVAKQKADGMSDFAMQHMLVSDLADELRYPLRLENLIVFPVDVKRAPIAIAWGKSNDNRGTRVQDIESRGFGQDALYGPIYYDTQWEKYHSTKMYIDPAGESTREGTDKTGYAVGGYLNSYIFMKAVGGYLAGHTPETLQALALLARQHHVSYIGVENVALQSMFTQLLRPYVNRLALEPGQDPAFPDGWHCTVENVKPGNGFKEERICNTLEPLVNNHRLVVGPQVAGNYDWQHQFTRIMRQRKCLAHEDELDATAGLCRLFTETIDADPYAMAQRQRDQEIEKALTDFRGGPAPFAHKHEDPYAAPPPNRAYAGR